MDEWTCKAHATACHFVFCAEEKPMPCIWAPEAPVCGLTSSSSCLDTSRLWESSLTSSSLLAWGEKCFPWSPLFGTNILLVVILEGISAHLGAGDGLHYWCSSRPQGMWQWLSLQPCVLVVVVVWLVGFLCGPQWSSCYHMGGRAGWAFVCHPPTCTDNGMKTPTLPCRLETHLPHQAKPDWAASGKFSMLYTTYLQFQRLTVEQST